MRAAIKRLFDSGDVATEAEAIQLTWEKHIQPHIEFSESINPYVYNQQKWREERFWNEECDNILKAYGGLF